MQGFKFTLLAASYTSPRGTYRKPFTITLPDGCDRIPEFRGNGSFKEEPVTISDTVSEQTSEKAGGVTPIEKIEDQHLIDLLNDGGYKTLEEVVKSSKEDLQLIDGVGEATAKKILVAASEAIESSQRDEE